MVQFTRSFVSLCLIAASFSSPTKRTVAQVEADIANIATQVNALDNAIEASDSVAITLEMELLGPALNTGTSDMEATGPLDEADATTILNDVIAIQPVIIDSLTRIAAEAPSFAALPVAGIPGLVLVDLETLKSDTDAFAAALEAAVPADLKPEATSIQSAIDAAFATAIAAYS